MPTPGEYKTVQARILAYAEAMGWAVVSREEAERRRGFDSQVLPAERARNRSIFFGDLLDAQVWKFNRCYAESEGALIGKFRHLHTGLYGNWGFVETLSNRVRCLDYEEKCVRDRTGWMEKQVVHG